MNEDIICMILVTLPVLVFAASLRAVDEPLATGLAFLCGFSVGGVYRDTRQTGGG